MSVYPPTKNTPYWQYDFTSSGQRFRGSTKETTRRKAEAAERNIRLEVETRIARGLTGARLNEVFGRYWIEHAQHHANADTEWYQLENLKDGLGDILVKDIPDALVSRYVAKRRGQKTKRGTLPAPATINREVELLRRVLRTARDEWGIDVGRLPNFNKHRREEPKERLRYLTYDEEVRLFDSLWTDMHPITLFSLCTGVRLSNATGLTWNMIDEQAQLITMRQKGGDILTIPVTKEIGLILQSVRGQHPIYVFSYECRRTSKRRRKGERYPFSVSGWRRSWQRALKAAGISDYRWHDNRHTAGTRILARTNNLKLTQRLLGHRDISTTVKYAHVDTDQLRAAMESVSESTSESKGRIGHNSSKFKEVR